MNSPPAGAAHTDMPPVPTPRVWVVTGYRAGERGQILALAEAIGWPYEVKTLDYRRRASLSSLLRQKGLAGISADSAASLQAPWPDLVISAGMRNEPVARWIRAQSGDRARLVHIGRPWAPFETFDLVVTTPQYRLPERANILHNTTTLHGVTPARLSQEASAGRSRYDHLPGPYLGVILGGHSGPYTLGVNTATRIAQKVNVLATRLGASVLATSSARTPESALQAFERGLCVPHDLYRWRAGDPANPYFGVLALSDALVVTADSISMLSEATATGKPVYMAELSACGYPMRGAETVARDFRWGALVYSTLMRFGHPRMTRDLRRVHRALLTQGRAVWLGEVFPESSLPPVADVAHTVQRIRAMFAEG